MIQQRLFVYGTLKPGFENNYILAEIGGVFDKATLFGYTLDNNWEKQTGYPGLVKSDSKSKVAGYLFTSKKLTYNWDVIDNFETNMYIRSKVTVVIDSDVQIDAYTYIINANFNISNF